MHRLPIIASRTAVPQTRLALTAACFVAFFVLSSSAFTQDEPLAIADDDLEVDFRLTTAQSFYFAVSPHEYGPPGYIRRREGRGPSVPVHVPVESHWRRSHLTVIHGECEEKTLLRWGGDVHLDTAFDFQPIGSNADFVTATIPVPQERGQNSNFNPRRSRVQLKTQSDSHAGPITGFAQVDFFDGNMQGAFGLYRPRMRYFYFDVGILRFGQDASVFMDYDVFPNVVEYEGPAAIILMRQSLIRMTLPVGDQWNIAVAAEQPFTDIFIPLDAMDEPVGENIQDVPDLTGHLRYDGYRGHLQVSGLLRQLTFEPRVGDNLRTTGYGVNVTGDLHPWAFITGGSPQPTCCPTPHDKSRILWQYATGYGIERYIQDANGLGIDAAIDGNGELDALFARAWFVAYEHWWADRLSSTFVYSRNTNSGAATLPSDTYVGATYVAGNVIWNFSDNAWAGIELLWGERENLSGESATARRVQFGAHYTF